jgi:DNA-binding SARP family transcriptional activator/tetratricopeptide (TPR) repeat protein
LDFSILGPLEVRANGELIALGGPKQRALLAILLLNAGRVVSRDRLIEALWAERAPGSARHAVEVNVSRLRKSLGATRAGDSVLATRAPGYVLHIARDELDLQRFERLLADGRRASAGGDSEGAAAALREAESQWRGRPLADLEFEPFARTDVERLEELRLVATEERVEAELALGLAGELVAELGQLTREHPWRERLHVQFMLALYRSGQQADALAAFVRAREVLVEQLGIEPGAELAALHQAMLVHDVALDSPRAPNGTGRPTRRSTMLAAARRGLVCAPALALDPEATFAGREAELAIARAAWDDAAAGHRQIVLVSGEPGIGKTRLAAEIAAHAVDRGATVLYGHCDDGLAAPAQPFAEALGAFVAACPADELRLRLGATATDLHPVVPALRALIPRGRAPAPVDPDLERLRACEAVAALLAEAGEVAPVLLVLDDLHWADELSLQLLRHLGGGSPAVRLLVLATYRDTEASRSPLLPDLVASLGRTPDAAHVPLGPLAEEAVAALLEHAGRAPELAGGVRTATRGNPFFVGELVHALGEQGTPITPRVRDVVRGRLAGLPPEAGVLLAFAAVAGPEFDLDVVARAAGLDTDDALDALEAAERARLVVPAGRLDRFTFAHALVRQAIVEDLPASRQVRMHARIARALERAATVRAVPAGELAVHLDAAGSLVDARSALLHARRAGDEAAARLAFDVAADHYERALRAHERFPVGDPQERRDLDLARARAREYAGDPRAYDMLGRVAADAEAAGDGTRMAEALLEMGGLGLDFLNEDGGLIALLRRALALVPTADGSDRARLLGYLALRALYSIPDAERAAIAAESVAMARRTGDGEALASTLILHSWTVMDPERVAERLAIADDLVALQAPVIPFANSIGHVVRFMALVELGDVVAADAALAQARASARVPAAHWTVMETSATRAVLAGDLARAETLAVQAGAVALAAGTRSVVVESNSAPLIRFVRGLQGRLGELEPLFAGTSAGEERPAWTFLTEAQLARARNDRDGAAAHFARAVEHGLLAMPRGAPWAGTLTSAADICAWLGDGPTAARLHALLAPCAGTMMPVTGPIARPVGALARTLGRPDEAERRLRDAVALCERMQAEAHLAVARLELGTLLGSSDEGRRLVAQAGETANRMGMAAVQAAAEQSPATCQGS